MAYTPGYSGLLNAAMPRIRQYEATTGRRIRAPFVQGLLQADLDKAKRIAMEQDRLNRDESFRQQQLDMQKEQVAGNRSTNMVGGVTQLAMLPIAAKSAGLLGGSTPAAATTTAQGMAAPAAATGTTAQGSAVGGGLVTGGTTSTAAAPAATTAGTAAVSETGLLSPISTAAGPAAVGAGLGMLGMNALTGAGKPGHRGGEVVTSNVAGGIVGGAIAGSAATSWSGPGAIVGGIIGGVIGGISSLF